MMKTKNSNDSYISGKQFVHFFQLIVFIVGAVCIVPVHAENNVDVVIKCIKKSKYDIDKTKSCAEQQLVAPVDSPEGAASEQWLRTEEWHLNKKVSNDDSRSFLHEFEAPRKRGSEGELFCGFRASEIENTNARWSVFDVYHRGATALAKLKGEGTFKNPQSSSIELKVEGRWLAKEAAGQMSADISCDGDGWSMKPYPKGDIIGLTPEACINYVMVCDVQKSGDDRKWLGVCGICSEQSKQLAP